MVETEWIFCPLCGRKTREIIREDTEMKSKILHCHNCKQEFLIDVKQFNITVIQCQSRSRRADNM